MFKNIKWIISYIFILNRSFCLYRLPNRPVINTAIVSATVHSEGPPLPPILDPPITLEYTLMETEERTKPVCVFWNHSLAWVGNTHIHMPKVSTRIDLCRKKLFFLFAFCYKCVDVFRIEGTGGWSSKGCEVLNRNNSHISCQCNHMTSFAVLMDISKREVLPKRCLFSFLWNNQPSFLFSIFCLVIDFWLDVLPQHGDVLPLKIVTYTTVSVSLFLLLLTLILLCLLRRLRSNLHAIHRNLVAALFFSELVFLLGINQTDNLVGVFLAISKASACTVQTLCCVSATYSHGLSVGLPTFFVRCVPIALSDELNYPIIDTNCHVTN